MSTINDEKFTAAYQQLNAKQREAVDTIEGPVMVIAGPGTGKTQILTLRIANILRLTQVGPENILALTFTKSGAKAMRERLRSFIGASAYRVPIFTFHGLAEKLITDYPEAYTKIIGGQAATEIEKIEIIEQILETPELSSLRPTGAPQFYVKPLLSIISNLKQENVLPDDLAKLIVEQETSLDDLPRYHEKGAHQGKERGEYTKLSAQLDKQRALLIVYRLYEQLLRERARYDFDDMILETVRVLRENESVRLDLQETYQYILADEHQDVNGSQNEILVQLTSYHQHPNLFVVGDEKQAIYRFQGASLENFVHFEKFFPDTKVIVLTDNYRSNQAILALSQALIAVTEGPLADYRLPLTAIRPDVTAPVLTSYPDEQSEHLALTKQIMAVLAAGTPPAEVAVIVRSNREVEQIAKLLSSAGLPVEASADSDVLSQPLFLAILDLLEAVVQPEDMTVLSRVFLAPYWGISVADTISIMAAVNYRQSLATLLADEAWLETQPLTSLAAIKHLVKVLSEARQDNLVLTPHRLLASLLDKSKLMMAAAAVEPFYSASLIRRLYDEIETLVVNGEAKTLSEVVATFRRRIDYQVALTVPEVKGTVESIQVMTAHKAKGLEFSAVFIPHLHEQSWGKSGRPQYFKVPLARTAVLTLEANEDERRLLYVALTRAKTQLFLSYADVGVDGKILSPASLLSTMETELPVTKNTDMTTAEVLQLPRTADIQLASIRPIIKRVLMDRGLSVTALNNYLANPWNYFYRNIVRLPEVKNLSMLFGTAIHGVLEYATKQQNETGKVPEFSALRQRLEYELNQLPLNVNEFSDLFAKGQETLVGYLPTWQAGLATVSRPELSVRVIMPTKQADFSELTLTGKIDRIDLDQANLAVRVMDYKTGKPKTRNAIEGGTASSDASYRRQLSFYALLLDYYDDERYRTDVGTLSFVEADAKGRIHEETFTSGVDEKAQLKSEIEEFLAEIIEAKFLLDEELLAASDYAYVGRLLLERLRNS